MTAFNIVRRSWKNKVFSAGEAKAAGITRYALKKLETQGEVEKIARGLYVLATGDISYDERFRRAAFGAGQPSVVWLLSALEYYDLTDIVSKEVWLMIPASKRVHQKQIRAYRSANLRLDIGIKKHSGFLITSIERTIVDVLTHQRQLPVSIGIEALRRAVQLEKTTLSKIVDVAKALDVMHRIRPYIEALA